MFTVPFPIWKAMAKRIEAKVQFGFVGLIVWQQITSVVMSNLKFHSKCHHNNWPKTLLYNNFSFNFQYAMKT